jgi:hypothetical protein
MSKSMFCPVYANSYIKYCSFIILHLFLYLGCGIQTKAPRQTPGHEIRRQGLTIPKPIMFNKDYYNEILRHYRCDRNRYKDWFTDSPFEFKSRRGKKDWTLGEFVRSESVISGKTKAVQDAKVIAARSQKQYLYFKRCFEQVDSDIKNCSKLKTLVNKRGRLAFGDERKHLKHCVACRRHTSFLCRAAVLERTFFNFGQVAKFRPNRMYCAEGLAYVEDGALAKAKYEAGNRSIEELAKKIGTDIHREILLIQSESEDFTYEKRLMFVSTEANVKLSGLIEHSAQVSSNHQQVKVKTCIPKKVFKEARELFKKKHRR